MSDFEELDGGLTWSGHGEAVRVEAWGPDSIRVRAARPRVFDDIPGALLERPGERGEVKISDEQASVTNGLIRAELSNTGELRFVRTDTDEELLAEEKAHFWWPGTRLYLANGNGYHRIEQRFKAYEGEKLYGLGQHQHGLLDQKGAVVELLQRNSEVTVPFLFSNRGYGLLWNSPAIGRTELAVNGTRWVADSARQIDYWVTTGERPADVMAHYAEVTGFSPMLPDWGTGFWQSKLRYRTQDELLAVAREYKERGLPLEVIVCDFFHWTHLGEWRFDPAEWPDPQAMVDELEQLGVKLMVSVWPSVSPLSENYDEMLARGFFISTEQGPPVHADWADKGVDAQVQVSFYDSTNPAARHFVWDKVRKHYLELGIKIWWLDACEPELKPGHSQNLLYHAGPGLEVGNLYPRENSRAFYDGMRDAGETEIVTFNRSAWAGSQRYGAALWSGDIPATFESLRDQIRAGLNVALSGIPWWTTDIGGFHGGDPDSEYFRELIVRWFQYGVFCPLFRLHGDREPQMPLTPKRTGGPNEVWSYGEAAYAILREQLFLRERLRPYVREQMLAAHETGSPPMRPVFYDFPDDPAAWEATDQFMFGPDLLVAPVVEFGGRSRSVYLPEGAAWSDGWTSEVREGGATLEVDAPIDRIPVFLRNGAELPLRDGGRL